MRISQSSIKSWMQCRRKYDLENNQGLRPKKQAMDALFLGSMVHELLDTGEVHIEDLEDAPDLKILEHAQIIVEGYKDWLQTSGADQFYETISQEEQFEVPAPGWREDVTIVGKTDKIVRDLKTGHLWILDYKTSADFNGFIDSIRWDIQRLHYMWLVEKATGERPAGFIWRLLGKSKRTDRAKGPFYMEYSVSISDAELESYEKFLIAVIEDLHDTPRDRLIPSRNRDCKWCKVKEVCAAMDDGSRVEDLVGDLFITGDPNERYKPTQGDDAQ